MRSAVVVLLSNPVCSGSTATGYSDHARLTESMGSIEIRALGGGFGGFTGAVALSAVGLPTGVRATFAAGTAAGTQC